MRQPVPSSGEASFWLAITGSACLCLGVEKCAARQQQQPCTFSTGHTTKARPCTSLKPPGLQHTLSRHHQDPIVTLAHVAGSRASLNAAGEDVRATQATFPLNRLFQALCEAGVETPSDQI